MSDNPAALEAEFLAEEQFDANDQASVNKRKQKIAREKREHLTYIAKILKDPVGRKWLYRIIAAGEVFSITYSASEDSRAKDFRDGKKFVPSQLLADAQDANFDLFVQMLKEGRENKLGAIYPMNGLL